MLQFDPALMKPGSCFSEPPLIGPCTPLPTVALRVSMIRQGSSGSYTNAVAEGMPAAATAAPASMMPAPQANVPEVVQSLPVPVGNVRAVLWIVASTCAGVSAGLTESISDAIPETCGVAMLVP